MIKKIAVIALVIVASLSVAGCTTNPTSSSSTSTPQPTVSPQADYSSNSQSQLTCEGTTFTKASQ
jgi:outer membrane lipoprotein SlyB